MRVEPSPNLVSLLSALQLATPEEVQSVAPQVQRLAAELGDFDLVWVDALVQKRILTPFQAAEINAGRGERLLHDSYVITAALGQTHGAGRFAARHTETGERVRLYVVERPQIAASAAAGALTRLLAALGPLGDSSASVLCDAGQSGETVWVAVPAVEGTSAASWMVEYGRLPEAVVLHVARAMLARLAELDALGVVHGNLCAAELCLESSGAVVLPMPGLRGIVRPAEGYSFADLQPEDYDYLAPERIATGSVPSVASDLYACGALWWHLLTGRPPFAGGNSLAKLKAVHAGRVVDVHQLAPSAAEVLARAIEKCLARDPVERPQSFAELVKLLGPPTREGTSALAALLSQKTHVWSGSHAARRRGRPDRRRSRAGALAATAVVLCLVALWPVWRRGAVSDTPGQPTTITVSTSTAAAPREAQPLASAEQQEPSKTEADIALAAAAFPVAKITADDLVLSSGAVLRLTELELHPGQRVRGRTGQRPAISVPAGGLVIEHADVCFEGVDFVDEGETSASVDDRARAMIVLRTTGVEFRGCSFASLAQRPPVAINSSAADEESGAADRELVFNDCVLSGLAAVVDHRGAGGISVEVGNSLFVAAGPIVRLDRAPLPSQTVAIVLDHVTTRGDSPVLECAYGRLRDDCGSIVITANNSALDGNPQAGLLVFNGPERPDRLLKATSWNGSGSLVTEKTALAVWRRGAKKQQALAEDELEVGGLVRSHVEFAGNAAGAPSASRVIRWHVPLRSSDPPGADTNSLYLPKF